MTAITDTERRVLAELSETRRLTSVDLHERTNRPGMGAMFNALERLEQMGLVITKGMWTMRPRWLRTPAGTAALREAGHD